MNETSIPASASLTTNFDPLHHRSLSSHVYPQSPYYVGLTVTENMCMKLKPLSVTCYRTRWTSCMLRAASQIALQCVSWRTSSITASFQQMWWSHLTTSTTSSASPPELISCTCCHNCTSHEMLPRNLDTAQLLSEWSATAANQLWSLACMRHRCAHNVTVWNKQTRTWANVQPDGRPAEHRWCTGALCSMPQSLADAHY